MGEDGGLLTLDPVPDLDGTLDHNILRDMEEGSRGETGPVKGGELLGAESDLGAHEALAEEILMLARGLIQGDQEDIRRESLGVAMDHLVVGKDHLGTGLTQPRGARNEGSAILHGGG